MSSPDLKISTSPTKPGRGSQGDDEGVLDFYESLNIAGNPPTTKGPNWWSFPITDLDAWGGGTVQAHGMPEVELQEDDLSAWMMATLGRPLIGNPYHSAPPSAELPLATESIRKVFDVLLRTHLGEADIAQVIPPATPRTAIVQRCLRDLDEDARQQKVKVSSEVRSEVGRILLALKNLPVDVSVVADKGGAAEIEVFNTPHGGFLLRCEPGRKALCVVSVDRYHLQLRYPDSQTLPDFFVERGLSDVLQRE
ncbi:MAG: hypothetical protein OXH41_10395 [Chloroflexi bacterium]|nr:hypothetical protein [Chloroflexota bacterium]